MYSENTESIDPKKAFVDFLRENKINFDTEKPASEFTSFRIGGDCFVVYPESVEKLIMTIRVLKEIPLRFIVIGAGSNVLFSDEGYNGVIILTKYLNKAPEIDGNVIKAYCGASLFELCKTAENLSLTGAEFAYGIPGSVGGAVFMNAGAYGGEIKDICRSVTVYSVNDDSIRTYGNDECRFGYRHSRFSEHTDEIVLFAEFELQPGVKEEISAKMAEILQKRKDKQPLNYPSAGSVFKRYPGRYTGQMIEAAGLKGYTVGGAQVSEKHAGFIINKGKATASDVVSLIKYIKDVIMQKEGVELECELRIIQ